MRSILERVGRQTNIASLVAHMCGFLCAGLVPFILTIVLVRWLHGSVTVIWIAYGVNSLMSLFGCVTIMGMARIGTFVGDMPQFLRTFRFAFVTTLLMPILLGSTVAVFVVGAYDKLTNKHPLL